MLVSGGVNSARLDVLLRVPPAPVSLSLHFFSPSPYPHVSWSICCAGRDNQGKLCVYSSCKGNTFKKTYNSRSMVPRSKRVVACILIFYAETGRVQKALLIMPFVSQDSSIIANILVIEQEVLIFIQWSHYFTSGDRSDFVIN